MAAACGRRLVQTQKAKSNKKKKADARIRMAEAFHRCLVYARIKKIVLLAGL
jgi:hypothetical protein